MSVAPIHVTRVFRSDNVSNMHSLPGRSVWDEDTNIVPKKDQSTTKTIWKALLIGLLIALFIGIIATGIIIASWILSEYQQTTNSTSTTITTTTTVSSTSTTSASTICSTTAITTTNTLTPLPSQCSTYTLLTNGTRYASYPSGSECDDVLFTPPKWVRFSDAAGTMLANCPVPDFHCGSFASGWYSGVYPSAAGNTTTGNVCFNFLGNTCNWPTTISITNCNGYYVFYLVAPTCASRYCTI